jgi:hypothetical protein
MWSAISSHEPSLEKDRHRFMNNNLGVVERSANENVIIDNTLDTINNYKGNFLIKWKAINSNEKLSFVVFDMVTGGNELMNIDVFPDLNSVRKNAPGHNTIFWTLKKGKREVEKRKYIRFWDTVEYTAFETTLKNAAVIEEGTAEWYFMMGFCLEENHFVAEALDYYKSAYRLAPEEKRFERIVFDFEKKYNK